MSGPPWPEFLSIAGGRIICWMSEDHFKVLRACVVRGTGDGQDDVLIAELFKAMRGEGLPR